MTRSRDVLADHAKISIAFVTERVVCEVDPDQSGVTCVAASCDQTAWVSETLTHLCAESVVPVDDSQIPVFNPRVWVRQINAPPR